MAARLINLNPLAGQSTYSEFNLVAGPGIVQLIVPADPNRWCLTAFAFSTVSCFITGQPNGPTFTGISVPTTGSLVLKYTDLLGWLQQDLWLVGGQPGTTVFFTVVNILPRG